MEKQILDGSFLFTQDRDINALYSKIINMDICPAPFENNSYQQNLSGKVGDLPDRGNFFLRKRRGLEKARFKRNGEDIDVSLFEFLDSVVVDGIRFLLAKSRDRKKIKIFKQLGGINRDICVDDEDTPYQEGWFEDITYYFYNDFNGNKIELDYFPGVDCLTDRFCIGYAPKDLVFFNGFTKAYNCQPSITNHSQLKKGRIINKMIGNEIITYFVDEENQLIEGNAGDYLYIYGGPYCTQHIGISGVESSVWEGKNGLLLESSVAGFSFISQGPNQTILKDDGSIDRLYEGNAINGEFNKSDICYYLIFKNRGDVIYFATSNGIYSLNNHGFNYMDSCFVYEGNTHADTRDNTLKPSYIVSGLVNLNDSIVFIDKKRGLLYHGLYGYQNTFFDSRNTLSVGGTYNSLVVLSGALILFGRNKVALINPKLIGLGAINFGNFLNINDNVGYWNNNSWNVEDGVLSWFGSDKQYRKTIIQFYGENAIVPQTKVENVAYSSLFSSLFRGRDEVYVYSDGRKEYFVIVTKTTTFAPSPTTIVIVKDFFWHQWIYNGFVLYGFDKMGAYGRGVFGYGGNRDDGQEIRTLVQMNFGEYNVFQGKYIILFKYLLGYNSKITFGNTLVRFWADYGGYRYKSSYGELYRRQYVRDIMLAQSNQLPNNGIIRTLDIGGNVSFGFGMSGITRTIKKPELESVNFQSQSFDWDKKTFDNVDYELSKYGLIEEPVSLPCNNFTVEILTKGDDEVEFGGFLILYSLKSIENCRIEDVGTIGDESLSKNPL